MPDFPPWKFLDVESYVRFTHLSAVMEGEGLMNSSHGWEYNENGVVIQRTKVRGLGELELLAQRYISLGVEKGFLRF